MNENVKPERDYSKPVSEEQEALLDALLAHHDLGRSERRRRLAEFIDRLSRPAPAPEAGIREAAIQVLADWLAKEMPAGTVIGDPRWWAPRIVDRGLVGILSRLSALSFEALRAANVRRCEDVFHALDSWSPTDWACAMAGETGEACNLIKKLRRGESVDPADIGRELADMVIYADLLAARLRLDLGAAVRAKFNEVSERRGSGVVL